LKINFIEKNIKEIGKLERKRGVSMNSNSTVKADPNSTL